MLHFKSRKDYDTNKLTPGKLQMAKQTYIILDEMRMEAGTLDAQGNKFACLNLYLYLSISIAESTYYVTCGETLIIDIIHYLI